MVLPQGNGDGSGNQDEVMRHRTTKANDSFWPRLKGEARRMRQAPTAAEELLWERLRGRRLGGFKFRRQHPIGRFVVDFFCPQAHLVVEVDGAIHMGREEEDSARTALLQSLNLRILRFKNEAVQRQTEQVLETIAQTLSGKG